MKWNAVKIKQAFGDKLVGTRLMKKMVCETLLLLPSAMIRHICATVWFISSEENSWAMTFKGSEIRNRSLIFLSDELFHQDEEQMRYTILHEVGHVILNHRNSIGYRQTASEIRRQEKEADRFARTYYGLKFSGKL